MLHLDRDLIFEICENLVCNPSSLLADLDAIDRDESPLPESAFKHFTLEDGNPAAANPFKVFLVNRTCANAVLGLFRKLPVLSIYSSYGSFETKNVESESEHQQIPLDHPTLQYILKNGDCKILELKAWGTVVSVLKEIQTSTIQNMRWGFIDDKESKGYCGEDLIFEFERILKENSDSLKYVIVDESLIPYVPYETLKLESFTIPFYSGSFDQPFLQHVNSKSLHLREAANACHIFSHDIYHKGCTPNPNVLNVVIDFSRTLHQEFRTKLNLCELVMELPIRFPKLESFKFIAEQDALLEDHYNRMICLREFGQSIYNIEEIMEGFEPCPFEFIVDIFCFVPRAALQFMLTQVFFGYHEAELWPEDKARYAFRRLEKYFGQENPRCLIIRLC